MFLYSIRFDSDAVESTSLARYYDTTETILKLVDRLENIKIITYYHGLDYVVPTLRLPRIRTSTGFTRSPRIDPIKQHGLIRLIQQCILHRPRQTRSDFVQSLVKTSQCHSTRKLTAARRDIHM